MLAAFGACSQGLSAQPEIALREAEERVELQREHTIVETPLSFVPPAAQLRTLAVGGNQLRLWSRSFSQGEAALLELSGPASQAESVLEWNGRRIPLHFRNGRAFGLVALRVDAKRDTINLRPPRAAPRRATLPIAAVPWPVFRSEMDLGRFSQPTRELSAEERQRIAREAQRKAAAFSRRSAWAMDGRLSHPRDMHRITSPFWSRRIVQQYRLQGGQRLPLAPRSSVHRGLDFRAVTGARVHALARGETVISEQFYYEGGFVLLDHGHGVFSMYMHMSSTAATEGLMVAAGDDIGLAGATGMVTGAHLHAALVIRGDPVDPLSLLSLPLGIVSGGP